MKESSAALETVLDTFDTFVSPDELALVLSLKKILLKKTPKKKRKSELLEGFMAAKRTDDKRSTTASTQLRASACW